MVFSCSNWKSQNDYCTATRYASSVGDSLTFTFSGTAVYVIGTIDCSWSGLIKIALDGNAIIFNRRACSLLPTGVKNICEYPWFTSTSLDPTVNHNLIITLSGPPIDQAPTGHIIADLRYIQYTVADPTDTAGSILPSSTLSSTPVESHATTSSNSPASAASQTSISGTTHHSNTAAIAGGVVAGVIGVFFLIASIFLCLRYRKRVALQKAYRNSDPRVYPAAPAMVAPYASQYGPTNLAMETTPWHPGMLVGGATGSSSRLPVPTPVVTQREAIHPIQDTDVIHRIATSVVEILRNSNSGKPELPPEYTSATR